VGRLGVVTLRWFVFLLLLAFTSVVPCAGAQSVTLTAPETTLATPDDALGDLSQPSSVGDSTDGLGDTAGGAVDSGSAAARTSAGKAFRTTFDRLPPRLERLLERIELGRNLRANLKRLEKMLGSVPVRERARLLRLLNAEVRRLRAGGVSPAERRLIQRLIRTRAAFIAPSVPTPTSDVVDGTAGNSGPAVAPGTGPRVGEGVLRTYVAAGKARSSERATPPSHDAGEPPGKGDKGAFALSPLLLALAAVLLVTIVGLAIKEERAT
jgi:hypothetical protein